MKRKQIKKKNEKEVNGKPCEWRLISMFFADFHTLPESTRFRFIVSATKIFFLNVSRSTKVANIRFFFLLVVAVIQLSSSNLKCHIYEKIKFTNCSSH